MTNDIRQDAEKRMQKTLEALQQELSKLRTGRAHPSLLEHVMVPYYGNDTPLNQVASVSIGDARTLMVAPWEKDMVSTIEKAILTADLGLNPTTAGQTIRVPLPPLTEDRRKELSRLVRQEAENAKVSVRNIRRDANNQLKDLVKDKLISVDEEHRGQDSIQKVTDKFIAQIDALSTKKENELMEV